MATVAQHRLARPARRRLFRAVKKSKTAAVRIRLTSVLRWSEGESQRQIAKQLAISQSSVSRNVERYKIEGLEGVRVDRRATNGKRKVTDGFRQRLRDLVARTPGDFGWNRTTWTRELFIEQLVRDGYVRVSVATMSRTLRAIGAKLSSPKPFVECPWSRKRRESRIKKLEELAASSSDLEPVYWEDEVDIHLNPRIGRDWTLPGQRRYVRTPGKNAKHYLAGALHAETGALVVVDGDQKASWLFCNLCRELSRLHPDARRIHLILDNYGIHSSKLTKSVLEDELGGRVVLHFLPPYCPDANRIERVWLDLHSNVTRNHRCATLEELIDEVDYYLDARNFSDANPSLRRAA